jgi:hypothetical protein
MSTGWITIIAIFWPLILAGSGYFGSKGCPSRGDGFRPDSRNSAAGWPMIPRPNSPPP